MTPDAVQKSILKKISLRLLPFLFVLYIVSYLDRINLSFAALQMNAELKFSEESFGFGAGIFFLGYCVFGIPSNSVIQKYGPRRWISVIMVVWGLVTLALCQVRDPLSFYILRFLLGAAEAGFFPGMLLYLTYWFPKDVYGTAVARFMTAIPAAGLLGSFVAARALSMGGIMGLAGWKWLFIITGAPAVVLGLLVPLLIPDGPADARWLTIQEKIELAALLGTRSGDAELVTTADSRVESAFANPQVWRFAFIYFSLTVIMYGFQLWLPQIIKQSVQDDVTVSLIAAVPALFTALGMLAIAHLSDRSGKRRKYLAISACITLVSLTVSALSTDNTVKIAALSFAATGIWGAVGPFWALSRNNLDQGSQASGIAFINSVGNLGGFAGPYIIGLIKQVSPDFDTSILALAGVSAIACLLALTSRESR